MNEKVREIFLSLFCLSVLFWFEKHMRYLAYFAAALLMVVFTFDTVSAQTVNTAGIKFKGIGLDSTYAQVVKALGKPVNEDVAKEEG